MFDGVLDKASEFVSSNGMDGAVKVLAVVGAYTTGKLIVKGGRAVMSMLKSDEEAS